MTQLPPLPFLTRLLAEHDQLNTLLPQLHEQAVRTVSGTGSMLLQVNPRTGLLHATGGHGLPDLPSEPWAPTGAEAGVATEAFDTARVVAVPSLAAMPELARLLKSAGALFVPLRRAGEPVGVLVLGVSGEQGPAASDQVAWVGDAFVLALELARLRREADVQREIRRLLDGFSRVASSALNLTTGLEIVCRDVIRLFEADRTAVWLHDRRARELVLGASSDPSHASQGTRVAASSTRSPAAVAMRCERAEIRDTGAPDAARGVVSTITVPLRGRRRALGALVFEGVRVEPGGALDVLDDADELGRQLSGAIENVQLLEEVLRSRREFESTFNSIPDLVAVCDTRLRLVQVNHYFSERLGMARDAVIGRPLGDLVGLETGAWVATLDLWGSSGTAQTFSRDVDDAVLGGRHMITVSTLIGPDGDPIGAVLVARDVSRQAGLELEQAALRDRLTESEKLAMLGRFVAGVAHDLNNPLQGVLGHLELLRREPALTPDLRHDIRRAHRDAARAANVVRDLLLFTGRPRLSPRPVSLNTIVSSVLRGRAAACRAAGVEVARDLDERLPRILADAPGLRLALTNVLINAEQAAAPGGRIEVKTRAWPARHMAVVEIHDSGPGIAEEALPRLFEPFFTTKEVGQGTGLGLTIAHGIVQEHGGALLAANHQAGGAVFTIELPFA